MLQRNKAFTQVSTTCYGNFSKKLPQLGTSGNKTAPNCCQTAAVKLPAAAGVASVYHVTDPAALTAPER
jgi:hypothetical protein